MPFIEIEHLEEKEKFGGKTFSSTLDMLKLEISKMKLLNKQLKM
jgi:hypothetical protein